MDNHSDDPDHEQYKKPLPIRISGIMLMLLVAVAVSLGLPDSTNILLGIFCTACCVYTADSLHFTCVERPHMEAWLTDHLERHHKVE